MEAERKTAKARWAGLLGAALAAGMVALFINSGGTEGGPDYERVGSGTPSGVNGPDERAAETHRVRALQIPVSGQVNLAGRPGYRAVSPGETGPLTLDGRLQERIVNEALLRRVEQDQPKRVKDSLNMPAWEKLFQPGGWYRDDVDDRGMFGSNGLPDFIDLYGGVEADFIAENLSAGVATDMSALLMGADYTEDVLYNGAVSAQHDLGNAYVLATVGLDNHLRIYAGIERLVSSAPSFIEIEFYQSNVVLYGRRPWDIVGQRQDGDLLVRMIFDAGALQTVELERFENGAYVRVNSGPGLRGDTCHKSKAFQYCVGPPPISHPIEDIELWDDDFEPVDPIVADGFVEIGVDTDRLAEAQKHYSSVLFRTPEDIALNRFSVFRRFADSAGTQNTEASGLH